MSVYNLLGKRIKEQRRKLELTQEKLSELCNLSPSYIGIIERGEKRVSVETLVRIANVLGVSADFLLGDSIDYSADYYIEKEKAYLNDMNESEAKYIYEFLGVTRNFLEKRKQAEK
ncbi:MAG: helix-turn-helix transcriptional regulator [Clostridia bacterium]|nr:helix-turn-helix transcriptional regulator [Clostridia bacterium]